LPDKRTLVILGAVLLLALGLGAAWMRGNVKERPKVSFTEDNLQTLESKLQGLEVEDLGGLTASALPVVQFSAQDLDQLSSKIDTLAFDDLEGLSTP
jgi:hypothetical protein